MVSWLFLVCGFPLMSDREQIFVCFFAVFSITLLKFFVYLHTSSLSDMHSASIFLQLWILFIFKRINFILCSWPFYPLVCLWTMCIPGAHGAQERLLAPWELKLQKVVNWTGPELTGTPLSLPPKCWIWGMQHHPQPPDLTSVRLLLFCLLIEERFSSHIIS